MKKLSITINGQMHIVDEGVTILQAAQAKGIHIPTLCHYEGLSESGNCMLCMVEITDISGTVQKRPACMTKVLEGMRIETDTPTLQADRKARLERLLSHHAVDCHHCLRNGACKPESLDPKLCESCFFCDCVRDGFCELQTLAKAHQIGVIPYELHPDDHPIDDSMGSLIRDPNKCIHCRRCVDLCGKVQNVNNLALIKVGDVSIAAPKMSSTMKDSDCVGCGHCVEVCPTGALHMKEHIDEVLYMAHAYNTRTAALLSDNVLQELAALYHTAPETITWEHTCAALRKIGIDEVYDEKDFTSYMNNTSYINNASYINVEKQIAKKLLTSMDEPPLVITDSLSVQNYINRFLPEHKYQVHLYENTQTLFGRLMKGSCTDSQQLKLIHVTNRKELAVQAEEKKDVDYVINARELYRILLRTGATPHKRVPSAADKLNIIPLDTDSHELDFLFQENRFSLSKEPELITSTIEDKEIHCLLAHNLGQIQKALNNKEKIHIIKA